ncbi:MAG TPA: hypothetical protein VFO60_02815 [Candidatus Dormibacteraeota bacterium]|nr:hypothetical protein [Candidatus Dormibacteraeota bacterium]
MTSDPAVHDGSPPGSEGATRAVRPRTPAREERLRELLATAVAVRATAAGTADTSVDRAVAADRDGGRGRPRRPGISGAPPRTRAPRAALCRAGRLGLAAALAGATVVAQGPEATPLRAVADAGADTQMFQLTNQDRTSNGVGPLGYVGSLQTIGEGWTYSCNGVTVHGRAQDMLQRNYFSHVILGCGQYVFSMMSAYGLTWNSAGENIGWSSGFSDAGSSVGYVNTALMNSPGHRANILNTSYTGMGVGSGWEAGPWTGAGSSPIGNVSMFAELFIQTASAPAPTPRPAPRTPAPTPRPAPATAVPSTPAPQPARNEPAPTPSLPAAVATAVPTPVATPTPAPPVDLTRPIVPPATETNAPPPLELASGDLLGDSVDAVLADLLLG